MKTPETPHNTEKKTTGLSNETTLWIIVLLGMGAGATSVFAQHILGLEPCALCLLQRHTHIALALSALLTLFALKHDQPAATGIAWLLTMVLAVGGTFLATYHSWLERSGTTECPLQTLLDPTGPNCAEIRHSFLGLTFANGNILLHSGAVVLIALALKSRFHNTTTTQNDETSS